MVTVTKVSVVLPVLSVELLLTLDQYKCLLDNKCKIDVKTRTFCIKCRLKKCYDKGMKKDYILSREVKALRKVRLHEMLDKRTTMATNSYSYTPVTSPLTADTPTIQDTIDTSTSNGIINYQTPDNTYYYPETNNFNDCTHDLLAPLEIDFIFPCACYLMFTSKLGSILKI
ncbi:unnamed protein product [Medioppia subpectinata]|uniref:Nuclear receptor domain-containing protein n=1 Tax=Medioppia subpectinata TaxID=1979941 RepID=A0A7R9KZI6_9ACAR|nr:unnamed protein product [Medioppia subpectinata]CAG2112499.1 unnamed protein product [Medioppia subpectinata]